ncbi:MAG: SDR family NAD(P)-dependent oxidoreductase [Chloroflexi bacterium]|nr:SDR family NAD(P)-dependent oxidoreductase [Chloroflexota bacterium]
MSWLVTGGCGFIGVNLADALLRDGESVVLFDSLYRAGAEENLAWVQSRHREGVHFVRADIRDAEAVAAIVKQSTPDVIAHLAGQVAMTTSLENPRLDFEVNAGGTLNILEAVRAFSPGSAVLFSSTNKVYGDLEHLRIEELATRYALPDYPSGLDERAPLDGHSPYGCSKLAGDQYVRDYARVFGLRTVVFRHSSVYGGRQFATFDQGWIGWFCRMALEAAQAGAKPFSINGNGKQVRDVLYIDDAVAAYRAAAARLDACAGKVYNLGGGMANSLSLLELFSMLERITGSTLRHYELEGRKGDQKVFVADIRRAGQDLGWQPITETEAGVRQMLEWIRSRTKHA